MKSPEILPKAFIIFFLLPVLLLVTCKEENDANPGNGYRIVKSISSLEGLQVDSTLYEYEGDKISLVHSFHDGQESSRSEMTYPDKNSVELLASHYHDSTWHESYKMVFKLADNQVTEIEIYGTDHGNLELSGKETFSYNNDNMTECITFSFETGNWVPVEKTEYFYNGTQFYQSVSYGYSYAEVWLQREKIVIYYKGNQVDTIHYYTYEEGSFIEDSKIGFTSEGDLITEYTIYSYHYGTWIDDGSVQYTYDSHNNLASVTYQDGEYTNQIEYYYEQGNGNYFQLIDYYANYLFGNIFPHPTKVAQGSKNLLLTGLHPNFLNFGKN